jgi:hypothetical protein
MPLSGRAEHDARVEDAEKHPVNDPLARLVDAWCERRALRPLSVLLPSYLSNNGLTDGWGDVMEALRTLRAQRELPEDELEEIERVLQIVEKAVYRT